jgi:WS/DGAT C-terminal domain
VRLHHGHLGTIRIRVPVSLHQEGDAVANNDSFFSIGVPLNERDPVVRLREVHAETNERKHARDAAHREELLRELSDVPPLKSLLTRLERSPRRFALSVSDVPGAACTGQRARCTGIATALECRNRRAPRSRCLGAVARDGALQETHSSGRSEVPHGKSEEAHGKSEEAHGKSEEAHGKSEEAHGKSEEAHGKSEEPHVPSEKPHGTSEESHGKP